ncbi:MAG: ArsR family transcriptional regulator [Actinomycetota bacterium]|nr:ArsR family transcriptional regulator [Actinomycetota bacterium]
MRLTGTVRGVGRQDVYEYPVEALREVIVHRDYSPLGHRISEVFQRDQPLTVTFTRDTPSSDESRTERDLSHAGADLAGRPAEILALFTGRQDLTACDIAQATGLSRAMTNRHLARLVTEGQPIATAHPQPRVLARTVSSGPTMTA